MGVADDPKTFEVGRCLNDTWELYCRHFIFILGLSLLWVLPIAALSTCGDPFSRLTNLLMTPWSAALIWGVSEREKGHSGGLLQSLWRGLKFTPRLLGLSLLAGLCILASAFMFLLPAVYAWVSLSLSTALAVAYDRPVDNAINDSYKLCRGHFWKLLGFWLAFGGILLLILVGHLGLWGATELSGLVDGLAMVGWLPQMVYCLLVCQGMAAGHLAGLAALQQLTPSQQPVEEYALGLTPVSQIDESEVSE